MTAAAGQAPVPRPSFLPGFLPKPTVGDVVAGVSVALVLIPQSLAYAELAGLPAYLGLVAAGVPLLVFALLASSPFLQTGPVALTALLTFSALDGAGYSAGSEDWIAAAALVALLVGLIRAALGVSRLGRIAYMISAPVMIGFMSAAALVILSSQLPRTFGVTAPDEEGTIGGAIWTLSNPSLWDLEAVALAAITFSLMIGGRFVHRLFPGVLAGVVVCLLWSVFTDYGGLKVDDVPTSLPGLSLDLPWDQLSNLAIPAVLIAFIGFVEPSTIARTYAAQEQQVWSPNRELISSGASNIVAGLLSAFPVGASFSRSSVNKFAGAETTAAGGITGLTVLAFLPFARILEPLPTAALGAIVLGAVLNLLQPGRLLRLWTRSRTQALIAWITFAGTLVLTPDFQWPVLGGILLTVAHTVLRPVQVRPGSDGETAENTLTIEPTGVLWTASMNRLARELRAATDASTATDVVVDLGAQPALDADIADALAEEQRHLHAQGRTLRWTDAPEGGEPLLAAALGAPDQL